MDNLATPLIAQPPAHTHTVYRWVGWFGSGVCSVWWDTAFEGGVSVLLVPVVLLVGEGIRTVLVGG